MREIKFRAWDGKKHHYTPAFNMHFSETGIICGLDTGSMVFGRDNQIQQYTGLKDSNGKEIYEGDILEMNEWDGLKDGTFIKVRVLWNKEDCSFDVYHSKYDHIITSMERLCEGEIIGNIHEPPPYCKNA